LAEIRVARTQVRLYTSMRPMYSIGRIGPVQRRSLSVSCEDVLQLGINAFEWLKRTEKRWIVAIQSGRIQYDPEMQTAFDCLFSAWLDPCDWAEEKIAHELSMGSAPENLESFRKCCTEARAIVAARNLENSRAQREEHESATAGH